MENYRLKQKIIELETKLKVREECSEVLMKIAVSLPLENSYKGLATLILEESKVCLGFDSVDIFLFSEDRDKAVLAASVGKKLEKISERIPFVLIKGDDFLEQESQNPKISFIKDIIEKSNFSKELAAKINTCSILKVPIFVSGNYQGVFAFSTSRETGIFVPNDEQLNFVKILSLYISSTIAKIISEQEKSKYLQNFYKIEQVANLGSWIWEVKTDILNWSDKLYEIFGIEKPKFRNDYKSFLQLIHPEDQDYVNSVLSEEFVVDKNFINYNCRIINQKTDKIRFLNCRVNIVRSKEGKVKKMFGTAQDVTELITIEKLKKETEENYKGLIEFIPYGLAVHSKGTVLFVNTATIRILKGNSKDDFVGKNIQEFVHQDSKKIVEERVKILERGEKAPTTNEKFICIDGSIIDVEITAMPINYNGKKAILVCFQNISERIKLEQEILKIKKLESIGVLAGGIAHDFNNILTGILANLSLAKILLKKQENVEARIKEAEKAAIRAKDLTYQLLTFAKGGLPILSVASIVNLIKESTKFALRGSKVKSEFSIQEDLWQVDVDEGQIGQVIHNLVLNASQAMQEGGIIRISAENILLLNESKLPLEKGNYVKISITDEGAGIEQQYLDRIFDPYFTTKDTGSGLGLATTFSIIKNHKGYISVSSKVGFGTKFSFYLRALEGAVTKEKVFAKEKIFGKGKILIMDDDEAILSVLFEVLQHIGYEVVAVSNGIEAITEYENSHRNNNKFDAVILDLTIPGSLGGGEVIEKLLQIDLDVKAIVSSGYSNSLIMRDYEQFGFKAIIKKPFNIKELSEVLAKVINDE